MLCVMLVNGRSEFKAGGVPTCVVHKGGYETVSKGAGTSAGTGGRGARTTGRPVAARPYLSPVPYRLPGRPTSDPGDPGLRRL